VRDSKLAEGGVMSSTEETAGRIVVGIDGSQSSRAALEWAADQARKTGTPLAAVAAWDYPASYGWSPPWPPDYDPGRDAKQMLEDTVHDVLGDDPDILLTTETLVGHPAPVLLELSKSASLLVVGSRGHGAFTGMLIGSVSEFLVTHAHCPVVVVRH
jgi:nucleotide-binding universal stress UspA family protein